jgi:multiple sugar transport system substrate-binding protein
MIDLKTIDPKKKMFLLIGSIALIVIVVITVVILLINANSKDNNNPSSVGTGELVYWGLWEPSSVIQPLIDEYESTHEGITILYSQQTYTNYESRLYTRLQQSTTSSEPAPDIFRIHNTWIPKYYKYLYALPSTVMTKEKYATTFYPTATADLTAKDGNIYAMPLEIDGLVVFYNKQLLTAAGVTTPPTDWDSFVELAQKLTKKSTTGKITQAGLAMGTSKNVSHAAEILSFLMLSQGIDIIDETKTAVTLNTTNAENVMDTYVSFASGTDATWDSSLGTDLNMFFQGKLAMFIAPSWRAFEIIQSAPTVEFGMATLPQLSANEEPIYYSTYWAEAVSKNSANPKAAWDFVAFLAQKEQQKTLYSNAAKIRAFGEPYSLVELNTELAANSYGSAIAASASKMVSWQMGDESFVKATLNEAITSIVEDGTDTQLALKNAETAINNQLAQTNK